MDQPLKFGFIPIEGGSYDPELLEEVLLGEKLGFGSVGLEEHHRIRMDLGRYENWAEALTLMRTELVIRESCGCRPPHSNDPQDEFLTSTRR